MNQKLTSYPKEKINILFLENVSEKAVKQFEQFGYLNIKQISGSLSEDEIVKAVKHVHLLGIRSKTSITKKVLDAAEKLQAIGCFCIGVNQVDIDAATKRGIVVFNSPYSNTRSVAELVIGASIMLMRKVLEKNFAAHNGKWIKDATGSFELRGKTLGIIGYGNIGSQVSVLAESFGMKIIYFDADTKLPLGHAVECKSLKELVSSADIISLHVPEIPSTKNLINKNNLKFFKKGSHLINYSRGQVVDLKALSEAIKSEQIGGAAVDVYPEEPENNNDLFDTPLQGLSNVLLTPHIGGSTVEAQQNIGLDVSNKLFQYLEKGITTGSHSVPALALPEQEGTHRILHIHKNVPGVLGSINGLLSKNKINIISQFLKTNEEIGYVVLDVDKKISNKAVQLLKGVKETIKVRLLY